MKKLLTLFLLYSTIGFAQNGNHQTSNKPGCCSDKTGLPFTYNPEEADELFQLYISNKSSEKSAFYGGKYDPWKDNKDQPLYNQGYMAPPGSLPIAKGVFVDQTEVANIQYQEFLYYVAKDSGKYKSNAYQPKTDNKIKTKYFLDPEFYFYPVVAVSHENAQKYCEWRAEKLNVGLKEMLYNQIRKYRYIGRLLKEDEWKQIAGEPDSLIVEKTYSFGNKQYGMFYEDIISNRLMTNDVFDIKEYHGYNFNLKSISTTKFNVDIPFYIYSFERNQAGFYNLYGNVKELVEEGYAIGGSFKTGFSTEELFSHDDVQSYRTDVGFRCLIEVGRRR